MKFQLIFAGHAAGTDPYEAEFLKLVAERPWCRHAGFMDRESLKLHLRSAACVALPSLEDNCPMVVLEAMAASVPVLAAKVGGLPDLIDDGSSGVFCNPLAADSMKSGLQSLLENPAFGRRIAAEAKSRARDRFHPRLIAQRHVDIYREVLSTSS